MHAPKEPNTSPEPPEPKGKAPAETQVIPLIEEEVTVSRVTEKTGNAVRVRIASQDVKQRIPVSETVEEVSVERVPIHRYVNEHTPVREEGNVVIIPVFETVAVVEQRLLLKEEIHIVRRRREIQREEEVVLRKDVPIVERRASDQDEWSPDAPDRDQEGR